MIKDRIVGLFEWSKRVIHEPRSEMSRWQKALRYLYDVARVGARQLRQDRAPQMAAALSFRMLFALLPVVVVSTLVLKGTRGVEEFQTQVDWMVQALGLNEVQVPANEAAAQDGSSTMPLGQWLKDVVNKFANASLKTLGWLGLAVVIYSAIAMMVTIENSFNTICRAPGGRSWTWRILLYWFVLTIGPAGIALTIWLDTEFGALIGSVGGWNWALTTANLVWSFCFGWIFLFLVYKLVPNTSVGVRWALIGAFVATLLLGAGKNLLGAYFNNAFSFSVLYGAVGLIPVFMFWVYLMWLVVLFGLEVAATLQRVGGRTIEELEPKPVTSGIIDPAAVVAAMQVAAENFRAGRSSVLQELAEATGISEDVIQRITDRLVKFGYLHRLSGENGAVSLARPPDQISAAELIQLGFAMADESSAASKRSAIVERLREAQRRLASTTTLAMLVPVAESPEQSDQAAG